MDRWSARRVVLSVLVAAVTLFSTATNSAADVILWDNGPVTDIDSGGGCDQQPIGCGGSGSWTYFDNFTLANDATITRVSYIDWFNTGDPSNYLQTYLSFYSGDPFATAPLLFGGFVGSLTALLPPGQYQFAIDLTRLGGRSLPAGEY
jgi:hypothetical protein